MHVVSRRGSRVQRLNNAGLVIRYPDVPTVIIRKVYAPSDKNMGLCQAHEESEGFNPGWLEDENERIVAELPGSCVTPLCSQPGRVALTATRIYFQPFNISSNSPVEVYQLNKACSLLAALLMSLYQLLHPFALHCMYHQIAHGAACS